ncbi:hypothetical protein E4U42_004790 [Claviceps africana]|uniref:Uncharacterized protein n=1 Tax=Claviceps africana TaxID=83212 RepID=A0A8K0J4R0_9HYPO|nr:hypothetical protein E4U42_004790 [Claviceps africana]
MHAGSGEAQTPNVDLSGLFTLDDLTKASLLCQVDENFSAVKGRMEGLVRNIEIPVPDEAAYMVTIFIILSVQDIIRVDRRAKPAVPW